MLVNDIFSFFESSNIGTIAFDLGLYLTNEVDYLPWSAFISRMAFYLNLFETTTTFAKMQAYSSDLSRAYYNKLGWIDNPVTDAWTDRLFRNNLVTFACRNNLAQCVSTATGYFTNWINTGDFSM